MIYGVMQSERENKLFKKPKTYDYVSVLYPQGNLWSSMHFLFNQEDI